MLGAESTASTVISTTKSGSRNPVIRINDEKSSGKI